ncbi:hypothetical protein PCK1_001420 [Pneumocystis canis]|nr:hypothetical protein PCK1_001420 [Pneumocystis canis]
MEETSEYEFSDEEGLNSILEATEAIFQKLEFKTDYSDLTKKSVNNAGELKLSHGLVQTTLFGDISKKSNNLIIDTIDETTTHHEIDKTLIKTWIYPTNISERVYQFNIVQKALYQNVLVSLPTGLGKTFIAAVLMFNYYRWFPKSKIIFVAPTKPLVSQQIQACYNICGIPSEDTIELSGNVKPIIRSIAWDAKRVFFMTPQALQNDLESGICNKKSIVCLVIDEAHRATGNYAYCNVVRMIRSENKSFRILALTATPGTDVDSVQEVINSLCISRIELRTEDSIDIRNYLHSRIIETIVVPLSEELTTIRNLYSEILKPLLQKLNAVNAYHIRDPGELTTFGLIQAQKSFMKTPSMINAPSNKKGEFSGLFSFLCSLAYPMSLLICHGLNPFYTKMKELIGTSASGRYKTFFKNNEKFKQIVSLIEDLKLNPSFSGHPKLDKVRSLILNHFTNANDKNEETRAMIFVEYRSSAEDIIELLKGDYPLIKAQLFIGQSSSKSSLGMSQKEQIFIIKKFKEGIFNTLVATSIGEEGLDIGEVDLIICYDSSSSSTRLLQRMGRTGRKREGRIYILLTAGREEKSYFRAKDSYKVIQKAISNGNILKFQEKISPRIIPKSENPECHKQELILNKKKISNDIDWKYIKKYEPKHQKNNVALPKYESKFITASTLHKQAIEGNDLIDHTKGIISSEHLIEYSNIQHEKYPNCDIKINKNKPLFRKNVPLFPILILQHKFNSVHQVSHSRIYQRLIQTMQKIECIRTYKTILNNNLTNNTDKINTLKFRNILVKNISNYTSKKVLDSFQCLKQNESTKQKSLKNTGLKEIQKEQVFTYKPLLSSEKTQFKYFNRLKRPRVIDESESDDDLELPDVYNEFPEITEENLVHFHKNHFNNKSVQFFDFFLEKNEENICKNSNLFEPIRYPDGNIKTLNDEDIAYFRWSESFKSSKLKQAAYIISNENKKESFENEKQKEELKPNIPYYSKLVRNHQELLKIYGKKYKIIIETEDALDSYYYELFQKNNHPFELNEKKMRVYYWPATPIRI